MSERTTYEIFQIMGVDGSNMDFVAGFQPDKDADTRYVSARTLEELASNIRKMRKISSGDFVKSIDSPKIMMGEKTFKSPITAEQLRHFYNAYNR